MRILWIAIAVAIAASVWVSRTHPASMFGGAHWLKLSSVIVLVVALAIRWTAILTLGRSFSANVAIQDAQTIYKRGMYRWVRHPSYLGLLLVFLAIGLHSQNWISFLVVLIPPSIALLYRIQVEESALRHAFGDEYVLYSRATKRLIPGVY
ncbi:MAG: methyltransferase family protein [Acidobacteriaceae bacterium]